MIRVFQFYCLLFILLAACSGPKKIGHSTHQDLIQTHLGRYRGDLIIYKDNQIVRSIPMALNLLKTDTAYWYKWQIKYDTQAMRNYRLHAINDGTGTYEVDENNGIILPSHLNNQVLTSYFTVVQSTLLIRYDFSIKDQITFQVHAYSKNPIEYTGQTNTEVDSIGLYTLAGYQEALLKKVED